MPGQSPILVSPPKKKEQKYNATVHSSAVFSAMCREYPMCKNIGGGSLAEMLTRK